MSLPEQEAQAMELAWRFLLELGSGEKPVRSIRDLRAEARDISKHFPLGGRIPEREHSPTKMPPDSLNVP